MRYCGEYYDSETDLIYLRARYYAPSIGRFISEDPHWNLDNMIYGDKEYEADEIRNPDIQSIMQANNLYVYCMNNPIAYIDLTGEAVKMYGGSMAIQLGFRLAEGTALVIDDQGNRAIVDMASFGIGSPGASASFFYAVIDAPTIKDIQGASIEFGVGGSIKNIGGSVDITLSLGDKMHSGSIWSFGGSLEPGFEAHAQITYTDDSHAIVPTLLRFFGLISSVGTEE